MSIRLVPMNRPDMPCASPLQLSGMHRCLEWWCSGLIDCRAISCRANFVFTHFCKRRAGNEFGIQWLSTWIIPLALPRKRRTVEAYRCSLVVKMPLFSKQLPLVPRSLLLLLDGHQVAVVGLLHSSYSYDFGRMEM